MISRKFSFILIIIIITLFLCRCKPEQIILHGELSGYVTDASTSQPIQNAAVALNPSSDTTYTGNEGNYIFRSLAPGNYDLLVSKENYFQSKKSITIYTDSIRFADFNLEKTPLCKISVPYLDFGFDSSTERFTISNAGIGKLYYLVVADNDWITVSSSSSSGFLTNQTDTITVKIDKTGLSPNKQKVPIIVWSNSGQSWLSDSIFVFLNSVVDQDLNYYNVVTIGTQTWMAENLNVGKYVDSSITESSGTLIEKHCYGNKEENCKIYGGLYEWPELMQSYSSDNGTIGTTRGICPVGWHIPVQAEWNELINYLGGALVAGGKMKEAGTSYWTQPNDASNESEFTARPGGAYFYNNFSGLENTAYFWSASHNKLADQYSNVSYRIINSDVSIMPEEKDYLYSFSVRCIKDPSGKK